MRYFLNLLGLIICIFPAIATAINPADAGKVIRTSFSAADDGFDLARTSNAYSGTVSEVIFEPLLTYDYLARPARLVPLTATSLPQVSADGKTYVFHLKPGIYFSPDLVFNNQRRELTARDYAYTFKRILDPLNRSPAAGFIEGKIVGLDALAGQAKKSGRFDYAAPVAGLQVTDRYTLRIQLNAPDNNFLYVIAYQAFGAVAREVIEAYGQQSGQHPVGTGPYLLHSYIPRSKIVLSANPEYRGFTWDFVAANDDDRQLAGEMHGKQMPQVGRIEINIIEEEQAAWLAFQDRQIDLDILPQLAAPIALNGNKLSPALAAQGIRLQRVAMPDMVYTMFNYRDPVIGGAALEKIALRRAIMMSYKVADEIVLLRRGQAAKAEMLIPPGIAGYDPAYRSSVDYDPALANKLLDHFGYRRGGDGYRRLPDGKPLLLKMTREASSSSQIIAELWMRGLEKIGIRVEFMVSNFADNNKAAKSCELMAWGAAWVADFPDGENFLQLLYGPNVGRSNISCYRSAVFDALYQQAMRLPPGAQREQLYLDMNQQMEADSVLLPHVFRIRNWVAQPWVQGFKPHPFMQGLWQYLDVVKH